MARASLKNVLRLIEESQKEVPVEQSFLADLERSIEIQSVKNSRPPSQSYKPSSMNCIRNMYFQIMGATQDEGAPAYTIVGICNSGSDIHQRIENEMDCEYVNVANYVRSRELTHINIVKEPDFENGEYETKLFDTKLNISFLCDGIIRYKGKYYILEIKTENSSKFMERKGVDPKHYMQGTAYSTIFGIPNVIFVYINRDVMTMKSFMFTPTDDQIQDFLGKISTCDTYVNQHKLPPKPENASAKFCAYCSYRELCKLED